MQLKFCPQCGSMELQMAQVGETCKRCRYHGPMDTGSIDRINEIRKRFARGGAPAMGLPSDGAAPNATPSANAAPSKGGGLSGMSAAVRFDSAAPKPIPSDAGNKMLAERLKALKGKSTGDVEFL